MEFCEILVRWPFFEEIKFLIVFGPLGGYLGPLLGSSLGSQNGVSQSVLAVTGGDALQAPLAMYPFGIKEGPNGTSLAMYPSVVFAFQAQGYVSKGRRFLSDAPFGRFCESPGPPLPQNLWRDFSFSFLLKFLLKNVRFGRSLAQLILAALSIYPFGVKEGHLFPTP